MTLSFCSIEEAAAALAEGRILIVVDAEDRENEGDFLAAADQITPETIHFMAQFGRGQLCMPIAAELAERVGTRALVPEATLDHPRFAIPLDHVACTTGISPEERALTIQAIADPDASPVDFKRPGHIFPLIAQDAGVLCRPGHTETTVDLARLAGLEPAGVLCEICSENGRGMACNGELAALAARFDLPVLAINELIRYRRQEVLAAPSFGCDTLSYAPGPFGSESPS